MLKYLVGHLPNGFQKSVLKSVLQAFTDNVEIKHLVVL